MKTRLRLDETEARLADAVDAVASTLQIEVDAVLEQIVGDFERTSADGSTARGLQAVMAASQHASAVASLLSGPTTADTSLAALPEIGDAVAAHISGMRQGLDTLEDAGHGTAVAHLYSEIDRLQSIAERILGGRTELASALQSAARERAQLRSFVDYQLEPAVVASLDNQLYYMLTGRSEFRDSNAVASDRLSHVEFMRYWHLSSVYSSLFRTFSGLIIAIIMTEPTLIGEGEERFTTASHRLEKSIDFLEAEGGSEVDPQLIPLARPVHSPRKRGVECLRLASAQIAAHRLRESVDGGQSAGPLPVSGRHGCGARRNTPRCCVGCRTEVSPGFRIADAVLKVSVSAAIAPRSPHRRSPTRRTLLAGALLASLVFACLPAPAAENGGLEEIIVVAQKVEQNLEDVPASVSVLPGSYIEESGANNIADLNGTAPNVIFQGMVFIQNTANLAIRGIGFFDTDPFADQKTQVLVDGIPHARVTGLGHDQIDVERIEVLRGPQGTLFGRNSLAGTVNIITKDPGPDPGVSVRASAGEYGLAKYVLSAETGALMEDSLRARLTVSTRDYDGHTTNAFNGNRLGAQDSNTLRLKVDHRWTNIQVSWTYYEVDEVTAGIATSNLIQDPQGTADGDVHRVNMDTDGFNNSDESGFTLLADFELRPGTISLAANSHDGDFLLYTDLDGRAGGQPPARGRNPNLNANIGFDIDHAQDSVELRFHDAHSERWDYVLGVFAFQEKSRRYFHQNIGPPFSATFDFGDSVRITTARQRTNSIAAFAPDRPSHERTDSR